MEILEREKDKIKINLSEDECRKFKVFEKINLPDEEFEETLFEIFQTLDTPLPKGNLTVRFLPTLTGGATISVEKSHTYVVYTYLFSEEKLKKTLTALKNTDFAKKSALYKLHNNNYIWEILTSDNDPLPSRLEDFGKKVELKNRKAYLSATALRVDFPTKEEEYVNDKERKT